MPNAQAFVVILALVRPHVPRHGPIARQAKQPALGVPSDGAVRTRGKGGNVLRRLVVQCGTWGHRPGDNDEVRARGGPLDVVYGSLLGANNLEKLVGRALRSCTAVHTLAS